MHDLSTQSLTFRWEIPLAQLAVFLTAPVFGWLGGFALGCSSSSADGSSPSGGSGRSVASGGSASGAPGAGAGGAATVKLGGFTLELKADDSGSGTTSLAGTIYDGDTPPNVVWNLRSSAAECELLVPSVPFCEVPCGSEVCVALNRCVPYPSPVSVGTVRVQGVGTSEIVMSPQGDTLYYVPSRATMLPYPPAADGSVITLVATGGTLEPFTIRTDAIAPLVATGEDPAAIRLSEPLRLTWTAGASENARIHVELDLSHHGGTKGKVICDTADDGSLEIPGAMLTELVELGLAGFPTVELVRRADGSAITRAGVVQFEVVSRISRDVTVPGLVSCTKDAECPTGQTCQPDLQCK